MIYLWLINDSSMTHWWVILCGPGVITNHKSDGAQEQSRSQIAAQTTRVDDRFVVFVLVLFFYTFEVTPQFWTQPISRYRHLFAMISRWGM